MTRTFPTASKRKPGYSIEQVDEFLERAKQAYESADGTGEVTAATIRRTAFMLRRGGYLPDAVDAAMERLEDAFAERERDRVVRADGDAVWFDGVRERVAAIQGRLDRQPGRRFTRTGLFRRGYDRRDVDSFCDRIADFFGTGSGLRVEEVRSVLFRTRSRGYAEYQVDLLLDEVVEVLLAVR